MGNIYSNMKVFAYNLNNVIKHVSHPHRVHVWQINYVIWFVSFLWFNHSLELIKSWQFPKHTAYSHILILLHLWKVNTDFYPMLCVYVWYHYVSVVFQTCRRPTGRRHIVDLSLLSNIHFLLYLHIADGIYEHTSPNFSVQNPTKVGPP